MSSQILSYHKITDRSDFGITTRSLRDFEADVDFISSLPLSDRPIISFDDGYEDALLHALPILSKYNLTATIFVITGYLGKTNSWDLAKFGAFNHLSLAQLKELSSAGWTIGSHSKSHLALTTLSEVDLYNEVKDSKDFLEELLLKPISQLSFPFGNFNSKVIRACKEAGYHSAVSIKKKSQDGFVVHSKAVYKFDSLNSLQAKLRSNPLELVRLRAINSLSIATIFHHQLKGYKPMTSNAPIHAR